MFPVSLSNHNKYKKLSRFDVYSRIMLVASSLMVLWIPRITIPVRGL